MEGTLIAWSAFADIVGAYKGLLKEKEALEASVNALSAATAVNAADVINGKDARDSKVTEDAAPNSVSVSDEIVCPWILCGHELCLLVVVNPVWWMEEKKSHAHGCSNDDDYLVLHYFLD